MKNKLLLSLVLLSTLGLTSCGAGNTNNISTPTGSKHTVDISNCYEEYLNIDIVRIAEKDNTNHTYYVYRIECDGALDYAVYKYCTIIYSEGRVELNKGGFGVSPYLRIEPRIQSCTGTVEYYF